MMHRHPWAHISNLALRRGDFFVAGTHTRVAGARRGWQRSRMAATIGAVALLSACSNLATILERPAEPTAPPPAAAKPQAQIEKPPVPVIVDDTPSRATILAAQKMLSDLGYNPGPLDGVEGPKTRSAIREFQKHSELNIVGEVNKALVASLAAAIGDKPVPVDNPKLDADVFPVYEAGDTFVYSDGQVETVVRVDGDKIRWKTNRGATFTSYRNFILPPISWQSAMRSEKTNIDAAPNVLWPLHVGEEVSFTTETAVTYAGRTEGRTEIAQTWRCNVDGTDTVTVSAGTFDSYRIVCRSSADTPNFPKERVWYFAPTIGHYVRRDDTYDTSKLANRVELVAIRLGGEGWPPAARAGLGWAVQSVLESESNGKSIEWQSSGVASKVTIRPTAALRADEKSYCRTFEQTIVRANGQRIYPGVACRESSGQWLIPGLDDRAEAAPAAKTGDDNSGS